MAVIKCPECGHQVSDKASVCPNCGVNIAGAVTICPQCGEAYFKDQKSCPYCHYTPNENNTAATSAPQSQPVYTTSQPVNQPVQPNPNTNNGQKPKKKNTTIIIISLIIAIIICAIGFHFYNKLSNGGEKAAYENAMKSSDPQVLQSYLDKYKDASEAHRDSISNHLSRLKQTDQAWTNAVVSGSVSAIKAYLEQNPNSLHKSEAIHKIDSIDWAQASVAKTLDAYKLYLTDNPNGEHVDDANNAIKTLNTNTVSPEEKAQISGVFKHFFQSINTKDESGLTSTVSSFLTSFLGKSDATPTDVVTFMNKIYKEDITNMNWRINNDYKITKKEIGDNEYEYTVQFSANQQIERTDPTKEKNAKYQIKAKVDPDGKITEFNMTKILQ